jgi:DNA-binding NarL/FixJ family response regulator
MTVTCIRLVVVDDHALFRRGLIGLLADLPEFEVVGEAGNGQEALQVIERTKPDIVLLDVNMPVMDGIATVQALRAKHLPLHILMLTISQNEEDLFGAIKAGADGYLLKNTEPDELHRVLLHIARGERVLSPEVTGTVLKALSRLSTQEQTPLLSDRELEVLHCLATGQTTLQISNQLYISENTVKTHIRHILEKLEASNRTEAVSKAMQLGLIQKNT